MIKFQLISRRKPGDTQEKYFYEWGIIHVALMISTPSVMRTFKRYAQHFTVNGVDGGELLYPLSDMAWDNFADHWLERPEDNLVPFESDDYMQRMHPHNFGDSNFVIEYLTETLRDDAPGFEPGGVKLVHVVRSRPGLSLEEFAAAWRERHAAALLAAGATRPGRLVQNLHAEVDRETFKGTLFELAGVGGYAGIEELWFDDLDALWSSRRTPACVQPSSPRTRRWIRSGASRWSSPSAWCTTTRWETRAALRLPYSIRRASRHAWTPRSTRAGTCPAGNGARRSRCDASPPR